MYVCTSTHSLQPSAPTAPRNVAVVDIGSTYANIIWLPPESPNGEMLVYTVSLTNSRNNGGTNFTSNELSANVTGLDPFVQYWVVVFAQTVEVGEGSSNLSFTTRQDSKPTLTHIHCVRYCSYMYVYKLVGRVVFHCGCTCTCVCAC